MEISEGALRFCFDDAWKTIKFDECDFFKKTFGKQPAGKGVDFITESTDAIQIIEVKDCSGHERDNLWRTKVGGTKNGEDPFNIEIAKKVAMSISCLYGAFSKSKRSETAEKLQPFYTALLSNKIPTSKKKIRVIFFIEGDFGAKTRTKKMIMDNIQRSLKKQLSWLQCDVIVVDSETVKETYFTVRR